MFINKSLLVMFIASFLQLWTTNKRKIKKSKKSLLVTFIAWSMQNFGIQIKKNIL